jgi:hypothetical protein
MSIQTVGVGDPSQASGCDSGDAEINSVALAQFMLAIMQQLDQRAVDVAEAQEAEVVGMNACPRAGLARSILTVTWR